ncbi:hypothetical protein J2Z32_002129 [Paenibacillus turicensis]|uniref:Uncharacterized protein n=1 Tax=Paenibacillus turicensis TaxID=160487 RepID=A0ABS4FSE3_9BACL|nr:hypothetical protein [Paenibacillus turicensis]MBP1905499.1 hypothetical protein [Paenibacillus turicensis]
MPVTVTQDEHITVVKYADDKRPLKIEPFVLDCAEDESIFKQVDSYITRVSNAPSNLAKMDESKFYALVERLSVMVCKEFSPLRTWGVTKQGIRGIVLFILQEGIAAGEWPEYYPVSSDTFVQAGADYVE